MTRLLDAVVKIMRAEDPIAEYESWRKPGVNDNHGRIRLDHQGD